MTALENLPDEVVKEKIDKFIGVTRSKLRIPKDKKIDWEVTYDVAFIPGPATLGYVSYEPKESRFLVKLDPFSSWKETQNTIQHELSHVKIDGDAIKKDSMEAPPDRSFETIARNELRAVKSASSLKGRKPNVREIADWMIQLLSSGKESGLYSDLKTLHKIAQSLGIDVKTIKEAMPIAKRFLKLED